MFSKKHSHTPGPDAPLDRNLRCAQILAEIDSPIGHCAEARTWLKDHQGSPTPACPWVSTVDKLLNMIVDLEEQLKKK